MREKPQTKAEAATPLDLETVQLIVDQVTLPRVSITQEDDSSYTIEWNENTYTIAKGDESKFTTASNGTSGMGLGMRMEMRNVLGLGLIEQDRTAPAEFIEVMMFHEIREREYREHGFEDAHNRAVHEEMLYVMKHLPPQLHVPYFAWAKEYRARKKMESPEEKQKQVEALEAEVIEGERQELREKRAKFVSMLESQGFVALDDKKSLFAKPKLHKLAWVSLNYIDWGIEHHCKGKGNDWKKILAANHYIYLMKTFFITNFARLQIKSMMMHMDHQDFEKDFDENHADALKFSEEEAHLIEPIYDLIVQDSNTSHRTRRKK